MATLFVDCDGTFFQWGTNVALPGAVEMFSKLYKDGHQLIFITNRSEALAVGARKFVQRHVGKNAILLSEIQTPRVLVDDSDPRCIARQTDEPWTGNL